MDKTLHFGIVGSGSWATALAKMLTDNQHKISWWVRSEKNRQHLMQRRHNLAHLTSVQFDTNLLQTSTDVTTVIKESDVILIGVPSAFLAESIGGLDPAIFNGKKILSAVKGLVPGKNILLNEYLHEQFSVPIEDYFAVLGPCHAEEVAAEKLSYLTFSGVDIVTASALATYFSTPYISTVVNHDIMGVQYAAVLKNIYAIGAGIAHGLDYGDNFLSVYIANAADEMAEFLRVFGAQDIVVGQHTGADPYTNRKTPNYAASVYLGDLLVTCYSLHSRNRSFGNMIGKGYSVRAAQLEMNMIAEGYNATKCIYEVNRQVCASMPLAENIYKILWENVSPEEGFAAIEGVMV
ncbi:MAG: NAD(P)-binding domain-containing protein [Chitinophagaceae bacterium]|nr:NAD(P)-binding domain-containing protein [Chitinophagaceae bacterium]